MLDWLPILVMLVVAVGFALASLGASYILSPKKQRLKNSHPMNVGFFQKLNHLKGFQ